MKNMDIRNTLLYNLIQNNTITIEREFSEIGWNEFMQEENTFKNTCNEILKIKIEKIQIATLRGIQLTTYGQKY